MDDTLPDDAWKDSFDKLLDPRPKLRHLNIIKQNVRASFNRDSSVENSNPNVNISDCALPNPKWIELDRHKLRNYETTISTPCTKRVSSNLFHCGISPITGLVLDGFKNKADEQKNRLGEEESLIMADEQQKQCPPRKRVCFEANESTLVKKIEQVQRKQSITKPMEKRGEKKISLVLAPGKWRKSVHTWRRTNLGEASRRSSTKVSIGAQPTNQQNECSVKFVGVVHLPLGRRSMYIKSERMSDFSHAKQLLRYCDQRKPLRFDRTYSTAKMTNSCKIGEGAYGEVFKYTLPKSPKTDVVLKVIPIEGAIEVNGEPQKTFEQILPEVIISKEMCNLRSNKINSTAGFVDVYKASLVQGKYPQHLIKLWEIYDNENDSENDHPKLFTEKQLFVVLELKFAGGDMSTFSFLNAEQAYGALKQIILTLAVGEAAYQFEHRDLHWGNILIEPTNKKQIQYKLNGKTLTVPTKGVQVIIIDYTLSRMTINDCCHYNDLSTDEELFAATGDYQFDIYRMMRDELKNDWTKFAPKTNVQWLSYVVVKLLDGVKYRSVLTKVHRSYIDKLKHVQKCIMNFNSATHCVESLLELT